MFSRELGTKEWSWEIIALVRLLLATAVLGKHDDFGLSIAPEQSIIQHFWISFLAVQQQTHHQDVFYALGVLRARLV